MVPVPEAKPEETVSEPVTEATGGVPPSEPGNTGEKRNLFDDDDGDAYVPPVT